MRSGLRILAVSAMKCTPQNTITSAVGVAGGLGQLQGVADEVGEVLDLGLLVVVREQDGVALLAELVSIAVDQSVALRECRRASASAAW